MDNPPTEVPAGPVADVLVVAGGAARRLGGADKAMFVRPDGRPLLVALLGAPVTGRRVVVGPVRGGIGGVDVWTRETPAGGGPVAALAAGVPHLLAPTLVLLAGDLVDGAAAVPALLAALGRPEPSGLPDAAVVWHGDRPQWLLAVWRRAALVDALARLGDPVGARMRTVYDGVRVARVDDPGQDGAAGGRGGQWSGDLDTPADVSRFLGPG